MSRIWENKNNSLKEYFKMIQGITWAMNAELKKSKYIVPVVYSFYSDEKCLYIGSTECFADRMDWHMRKKYWDTIDKIGVRVYNSRMEMRIAELFYIFRESPVLNNDAKYRDGKEVLFVESDGCPFHCIDETEQAMFVKDELVEFLQHSDWSLIV